VNTKPILSAFLWLCVAACSKAGTVTAPEPETSTMKPAAATTTNEPARRSVGTDPGRAGDGTKLTAKPGNELAAFAAGCFWGVEDTFRQVPGVVATAVGYTGGRTEHPTYESVCTHTTGHAETVLVEFDPKLVKYETLLNVFFKNHDPTTVNRQGPDVGDQYRSEIFVFSPAQRLAALDKKASEQKELGRPVATLVEPIGAFWKAEEYHQQYDEKTGTHSCPLPRGLSPTGT
jgi:peptide-methionine (S)-S-oxide reductase